MTKRLLCLLMISAILLCLPVLARPVAAQTPTVLVLDAQNAPLTALVDGNAIRLQLSVSPAVTADTPVRFLLAGVDATIADCTIPAGQSSCQTVQFPAYGWAWDAEEGRQRERVVQAQAAGQPLGESVPLAITPRPVVLVHGFAGSWENWTAYLGADSYLAAHGLHGYAVGDGQVAGTMDTGDNIAPLRRTNTLAQNAEVLGEYIRNVQQLTGAEQVDLLVHSMGGIIARYYLDRLMPTRNVAQLIILGSPMGGSACSVLPTALGLLLPASLELQPSYMQQIFNPQITRRQGVPFHALAGVPLRNAVQSPCTVVPSDLVVARASVAAIAMPVTEMALLHPVLNDDPVAFNDFVLPLLQTAPGAFWQATDPPAPVPVAEALQFTRVYTGHLQPGETQTVTINIDPGVTVATFALYDTSRSLTTTVIGANGNRLQLDPVANGETRVTDPATLVYLGYGFVQPRAGQWRVALQSTADTPATGADYAIAAQFTGGATLQATLDQLVPSVNSPVNVQAQLVAAGEAITLTNAQAQVRQPDGQVVSYPLAVQGNSATVTLSPAQRGLHSVELHVSAQTATGLTIDRAAFLVFEAQPSAVSPLWPSAGFAPVLLGIILLPVLLLLLLPLLIFLFLPFLVFLPFL